MGKLPEELFTVIKEGFGVYALTLQQKSEHSGGLIWIFDDPYEIQSHSLPEILKKFSKQGLHSEKQDILNELKTFDVLRDILVVYVPSSDSQTLAKIDVINVLNE